MAHFTVDELESAHKTLQSSCRKIEKVVQTLRQKHEPPKSQLTLATRNLAALNIALSLIARELEDAPDHGVWERLASYEGIYGELAASMVAIPDELEKLKADGKGKTVRYRELLGQKLLNQQIAALFERHGILFARRER